MLESVIAAIDQEIAKLQQARALLAGTTPAPIADAPRSGRPRGTKNAAPVPAPVKAKRTMSAEGRARISAAMKKRHAAKKRNN